MVYIESTKGPIPTIPRRELAVRWASAGEIPLEYLLSMFDERRSTVMEKTVYEFLPEADVLELKLRWKDAAEDVSVRTQAVEMNPQRDSGGDC